MKLAIVTASIDPERTREYWQSWREQGTREDEDVEYILVHQPKGGSSAHSGDWDFILNCPDLLGVVPAFRLGIEVAYTRGADVVACLHDDLKIITPGWDSQIISHFEEHKNCVLAGFSGADGLGAEDIYKSAYEPHQLARQGFFSNMVNHEKHGRWEVAPRRSACADGFSQIGRTWFMQWAFKQLDDAGVIHHAYDSWLGAMVDRQDGEECWYIPVECDHRGGMSATGATYAEWSKQFGGDQKIWEQSHRKMYDALRSRLPYRVQP